MKQASLDTPVALILFNRPEQTRRVFEEIAKARPKQLFLVADGPRPQVPSDRQRCSEARAVEHLVDWDCDLRIRFLDENLGCGYGPARGIDWVFEHVGEAIILEDDCLPDPTFFPFCSELLARYREDEQIMVISGSNFRPRRKRQRTSYTFLRASGMCFWGWATWRRAWTHHDMRIREWEELRNTEFLEDLYKNPDAVRKWSEIFDEALKAEGDVDYWDYQWTFAIWSRRGLAISPNKNLISNIGFGDSATHTRAPSHPFAAYPTESLEFPLQHPREVVLDEKDEAYRIEKAFPRQSFLQTLPRKVTRLIRSGFGV